MDGISIIPGDAFDELERHAPWRSPGGAFSAHVETNDKATQLCWDGQLSEKGARPRWQKAQSAEAAFWRTWRQNVLYGHVDLTAFWSETLEKTGGAIPKGLVVDVGCGPVSVLNFHRDPDTLPLGIDPLAATYASENLLECREGWQPITLLATPGEALPFAENSIDHLICFNVLDHVSDAPAVLRELQRVLKPGATLRVYVHTFANWIRHALFFDRPHTYHWSHNGFRALVEQHGFATTGELWEPKTFDLPDGLLGKIKHFPYWVATKVAATSYFQFQKASFQNVR